jgi:hypothetical protein
MIVADIHASLDLGALKHATDLSFVCRITRVHFGIPGACSPDGL